MNHYHEIWVSSYWSYWSKIRYWLPCIDAPCSRQTLRFDIVAPINYHVLANGEMINTTIIDAKTKEVTYECEQKCPSYLICFAVGNFVEVDDGKVAEAKNISCKYYAPHGTERQMIQNAFDQTKKMITWLQAKVSYDFPWPKYHQISATREIIQSDV